MEQTQHEGTGSSPAPPGFEFRGINHLALVCRDMARTVDFYTNVLGMPLIKTIELPAGMGQHFFFDCGGGDALAFFWFPDAPDGVPGVSAPTGRPDQGSLTSAVGSMNHVAFAVPPSGSTSTGTGWLPPASTAPTWPTTTTASGGSPTTCIPGCSSGRSTSRTPTGSCSNSPAGRARSARTTSPTPRPGPPTGPPPEAPVPRLRQVPRSEADGPDRHRDVRPAVRGPGPGRRARDLGRDAGRLVDGVRPGARRPRARRPGLRPLPEPQAPARPRAAGAGPGPRRLGVGEPVRLLPALQVAAGPRRPRGAGSPRYRTGRPRTASTRTSDWCWPTPTAWPTTTAGCPTACSTRCGPACRDEEILELTYITTLYLQHAVMSRALRTEFDDRPEPIVEVVVEGADNTGAGRPGHRPRRRPAD